MTDATGGGLRVGKLVKVLLFLPVTAMAAQLAALSQEQVSNVVLTGIAERRVYDRSNKVTQVFHHNFEFAVGSNQWHCRLTFNKDLSHYEEYTFHGTEQKGLLSQRVVSHDATTN